MLKYQIYNSNIFLHAINIFNIKYEISYLKFIYKGPNW